MEFGIGRFLENISFYRLYLQLKRYRNVKSLKKKNTIISLGCNFSRTKFGNHVFLGENVTIDNSFIDDYSYVNNNSKIKNSTIGKFCSIGPNVQIILGKHPANFVSSHPVFYANNKPFKTFSDETYIEEYGYATIGHDVWIGEGALIPNGVTVGNGAIITARSVVTKDVEPYSIVGGVPAKHIKFRFDESTAERINNSDWWNWDVNHLKEKFKLFHNPKEFVSYINSVTWNSQKE